MANLITESVAANFYAVAWNKLDAMVLKELLDNDVEYIVKKSGNSMKGRNDLLKYLQKNMNKIKKAPIEYEIYAETGETSDDKECTLLAQGNIDKIINAVYFTLSRGKIIKIEVDKYDPEVVVWRSGNYPGTESNIDDNEYVEKRPHLVEEYDVKPIKKRTNEDNKANVDIDLIKDKFFDANPKFRNRKEKNVILAIVLGFLLPGIGLFYISIKQGIYNLFVVIAIPIIYTTIITSNVMGSNLPVVSHPSAFSFLGLSVIGISMRIGSALWAYFVAKYKNDNI